MPSGRRNSILRAVPLRPLAIGAAAVVLAVSGFFGGLRTVVDTPPTVKLGALNAGAPWNVTVIKARLEADLPPLVLQHKGNRWLLVLAMVEVTADASRNDMNDILRVPGVPGLVSAEPSYVVRARDGSNVDYLNPGMPERLGFFWEQSASSPVPTAVDVQIFGKTQRLDSLTGQLEWLNLAPRARVRGVPVEDQRAS